MLSEMRDKLNRHGCSSVIEYIEELEQQCPPNEQGTNRFGLDVAYFRNAINRELNRSLVDFKPDELARVFARLSKTADKSVMFEPEFAAERDSEIIHQVMAFAHEKYTSAYISQQKPDAGDLLDGCLKRVKGGA